MIIGGNQYNLFSSAWFKKGIITLKDFSDETGIFFNFSSILTYSAFTETGATQTMKTSQKAELKQ